MSYSHTNMADESVKTTEKKRKRSEKDDAPRKKPATGNASSAIKLTILPTEKNIGPVLGQQLARSTCTNTVLRTSS